MTTRSQPRSDNGDSAHAPAAVLVHLSGSRRGTSERLSGDSLRIGTGADAEIHFPADREPSISFHHATLYRRGRTYELQPEAEHNVYVNDERVERMTLASGDVLQIGEAGPLLRFRPYKDAGHPYKSVTETITDCVDCVRHGRGALDRAAVLLTTMPRELATQTSPWFRRGVLVFLVLLTAGIAVLTLRSLQLEERLAGEGTRFAETSDRVAALEARVDAGTRIISDAAESIVFLQGAFRFIDPDSQKPLRFLGLGPDGQPLRNPRGEPFITTDGDGPVVERTFTGTAFVASDDGLLLTNRHVAIPWEFDETLQALASQGFVPVMHRFVGYLSGVREPFDVELLLASDDADVAVLRCTGVIGRARTLILSHSPVQPGDEVIVMGYPTGIRALLARAGDSFVDELRSEGDMDFWAVARRLSEKGRIGPLATRGIVGQVSAEAVVYDAETTSGGSGGPVIALNGEVVAVNTAILPEFGGSNLGVPVEHARKLLTAVRTGS